MSKNKRIIAIFLSLMMLISSGIFVNNAHAAQAKDYHPYKYKPYL